MTAPAAPPLATPNPANFWSDDAQRGHISARSSGGLVGVGVGVGVGR